MGSSGQATVVPSRSVDDYIENLAEFVTASPTAWHAAAELCSRLEQAGFVSHDETVAWSAAPGSRGFVVRDGAVIAWKIGEKAGPDAAVKTLGAHTDSPGFLVKPEPGFDAHGWAQVGVEVYGGPILNSWFDRDLKFAGRLVTRDGAEHLVCTEAIGRIPRLAIHLDRNANDRLEVNRQAHLQPIIGLAGVDVMDVIAEAAGVAADSIVGHEIMLADAERPARIGARRELFASGRLDNLSSTYAGYEALLQADPHPEEIAVLAAFDHEEVGSGTRAGAAGPLYADVVERLQRGLGADEDALVRSRQKSWVLSADAGHSIHPNYSGHHDPNVQPLCGSGPMLKINAQQHYASDAHGKALWARLCEAASVPGQSFVSNNTMPCGTTIGPITASRTGVRTVDVGVPLLSMHSVRELAHVDDLWGMKEISAAFFRGV